MDSNNTQLRYGSRRMLAAAVAAGIAVLAVCSDARRLSEATIRSRFVDRERLNHTARFLAGMDIPHSSALYAVVDSDAYRAHRQAAESLWQRYQSQNLVQIEQWRREHLKEVEPSAVMYPFSGPDILNALAFFPGADEYVMIGLENPGTVPDPSRVPPVMLPAELSRLRYAMRTILQLNLFRTAEMHADFKPDSLSNVTAVMMFFLARMDREILSVRPVSIDGTGSVVAGSSPAAEAVGVEFIFRRGRGTPLQRALFLSVDLSDYSLSRRRGVASFLSTRQGFAALIKSASYLLSYDNFRICRAYLLAGSRIIVQEDSGIPFRFFDRREWRIALYGAYRVLPIFAGRFQRDLYHAIKAEGRGPIPFSFGYGFMPQNSNIMVAVSNRR